MISPLQGQSQLQPQLQPQQFVTVPIQVQPPVTCTSISDLMKEYWWVLLLVVIAVLYYFYIKAQKEEEEAMQSQKPQH